MTRLPRCTNSRIASKLSSQTVRRENFVPRSDREIVLANIRSQLLTLEDIRPWQKNADNYSSACANGAFVLMERNFAPPDDRLRSLIAREKQMPALLAAARMNLQNPPRIFTEIAIEQLPDIITFFQHDVPDGFADSQKLCAEIRVRANQRHRHQRSTGLSALAQNRLLPRSKGDFRIGADAFSKKLEYDEMVDIPLDKLLEIGWADLRKNQQQFKTIAAELEPGKDPRSVLLDLDEDHPAPDQLLNSFRATFNGLIAFIRAITSSPSPLMCGPSSKRRRPSCAPRPLRAWTRPALTRRTPRKLTSTSRCPIQR